MVMEYLVGRLMGRLECHVARGRPSRGRPTVGLPAREPAVGQPLRERSAANRLIASRLTAERAAANRLITRQPLPGRYAATTGGRRRDTGDPKDHQSDAAGQGASDTGQHSGQRGGRAGYVRTWFVRTWFIRGWFMRTWFMHGWRVRDWYVCGWYMHGGVILTIDGDGRPRTVDRQRQTDRRLVGDGRHRHDQALFFLLPRVAPPRPRRVVPDSERMR
ncbi:hypothetical protein FrCorBMG51_07580 [Protofrankia coriariae]|uniref:Uncharacterized protein n=1 Tax=Protofrankia coriariae TaxID=1562887 RepID=A0ABR5F595_9ACTN|nr:hypothetical protein FrCorBMG51_07580 [Protofrankia coriariae]